MSDTYDFVVIGSGHNELTTAAYLAKAGQKILVLERNDWFGGGVVTKEIIAPGFKFDLHSSLHVNIQANPLILRDELQLLAKYGLKYLYPDAVYSTIFDDQTSIITYKDIDRTCKSIAKISPRDADAYRRFAEMSKKIVPLVTQKSVCSCAASRPVLCTARSERRGAGDISCPPTKQTRHLPRVVRKRQSNHTSAEVRQRDADGPGGQGHWLHSLYDAGHGSHVSHWNSGRRQRSACGCVDPVPEIVWRRTAR